LFETKDGAHVIKGTHMLPKMQNRTCSWTIKMYKSRNFGNWW